MEEQEQIRFEKESKKSTKKTQIEFFNFTYCSSCSFSLLSRDRTRLLVIIIFGPVSVLFYFLHPLLLFFSDTKVVSTVEKKGPLMFSDWFGNQSQLPLSSVLLLVRSFYLKLLMKIYRQFFTSLTLPPLASVVILEGVKKMLCHNCDRRKTVKEKYKLRYQICFITSFNC